MDRVLNLSHRDDPMTTDHFQELMTTLTLIDRHLSEATSQTPSIVRQSRNAGSRITSNDLIQTIVGRIATGRIRLSSRYGRPRASDFRHRLRQALDRRGAGRRAESEAYGFIASHFSPDVLRHRLMSVPDEGLVQWREGFHLLLACGCRFLRILDEAAPERGLRQIGLAGEIGVVAAVVQAAATEFILEKRSPRLGSRYQAALYMLSGHYDLVDRGERWFDSHEEKWRPPDWWLDRHPELAIVKCGLTLARRDR